MPEFQQYLKNGPVVAHSLAPPQRSPCAVLVLLLFRFIPATQLVLILVFFQEADWKLGVDCGCDALVLQ